MVRNGISTLNKHKHDDWTFIYHTSYSIADGASYLTTKFETTSPRNTMPRAAAIFHPLMPHPPRPYVFPLQAITQPVSFPTPNSVRVRFKGGDSTTTAASSGYKGHPFQDWKGTSTQDHAVSRANRKDTTDPETAATSQGREERAENEGIADASKSTATTERDLGQNSKQAKKEHPHAPEPIIGMTDERGRKGN